MSLVGSDFAAKITNKAAGALPRFFLVPLIFLLISIRFYLKLSKYSSKRAANSPIKGKSDTLIYEHIQLPNGLKTLVIHDHTAETASATISFNFGSFLDPPEYPGLAHFLEHLLFMGTEKYRDEAEYVSFISENSGSCNAETSGEYTLYHFSIKADFLEPALDRFSQFFTAPLFSASCVGKEIDAIDSEFLIHRQHDFQRYRHVRAFLTNLSHPFHNFLVANKATLTGKDGGNIRDEVISFYRNHYSADRMSLVVVGKEPIADLIKLVKDKFPNVPGSLQPFDCYWKHISRAVEENLGSIIWVKTLQLTRTIEFVWQIPDQMPLYMSKPASFLAGIIGHDGDGGYFDVWERF
ncbi:A-factor-processing enzyme [Mitosporidium daphniae]|uniref:A-factor-processing enzyme n=1 Tax=Mitosporidium daphniae TaxID=1485682 RepID=A0A098VW76_9MICR|nr:A-factor-processing enzyme [Mitosporidium daphniae]KGG51986.1 A-factor-processing enzyme [Mitosporidium daphniae]|eukprot:XP_013238413.1 A-factor-processing enzyme [Mitosporidium daphniae]